VGGKAEPGGGKRWQIRLAGFVGAGLAIAALFASRPAEAASLAVGSAAGPPPTARLAIMIGALLLLFSNNGGPRRRRRS
jgi:hypothetical protein